MSLYTNKLRSFAQRNRGVALVPASTDPSRIRQLLASGLDAMLSRADEGSNAPALWAHQGESLEAISRRVSADDRPPSGIVVVPTGGGKTEIFQRVVDASCRRLADGRILVPNTIVLVPTLNLVEQTVARFLRSYPHLDGVVGWTGSDIAGDYASVRGVRPITVMTYEGFARSVRSGTIGPQDVHLLIKDEAHRALSEIRQDVFSQFIERCVTIAFSATPFFDEARSLYALYGQDSEIINVPADRLRREGIIAPAVNYVLHVRIEGELPDDVELTRRLKRTAVVKALRDFRLDHDDAVAGPLSSRTFLGYMADVVHSTMARDAFNADLSEGEAPADVISGYEESEDQASKIAALKDGRLSGLFNSRLLGEGSDIPEVGAVLMTPTASSLQVVQAGGRAVRFDPRIPRDDPRQTAIIVNTVLEVNGKVVGSPVPYWKAIGDISIARDLHSTPIPVAAIDLDRDSSVGSGRAWSRIDHGQSDFAGSARTDPLPELLAAMSGDVPEVDYEIGHRADLGMDRYPREPKVDLPGWLGRTGIARSLGAMADMATVDRVLAQLEAECRHDQTDLRRGSLVVEMRRVAEGAGILFSEASLPALACMMDRPTLTMTDDWVIRNDVTRGKWVNLESRAMLDDLDALFLKRRRAGKLGPVPWSKAVIRSRRGADTVHTVEIPLVEVRMDLRIGGNGRTVCYHRDDLEVVRRLAGFTMEVPAKDSSWLDRREVQAETGGRTPASDGLFRDLERRFKECERSGQEEAGIGVGDDVVLVGRRASSKTSKPICYHIDSMPAVRRILGIQAPSSPKLASDLTYVELARRLGTNGSINERLKALRDAVMEEFTATGAATIDGVPIAVGIRRSGFRDSYYWDESCVEVVADALDRADARPRPGC
jgi:superfamily II DNA or RNA helicase